MKGSVIESMRFADKDIVLTDSRSLRYPERTVFFALRTPNNDGHNYIAGLAAKGVDLFVVENVPEGVSGNFITVDNTLEALQSAALEYRKSYDGKMIAVCGSRGKTIIKEWMAEALASVGTVTRSPRSWNSQIGVPQAIFGMDLNAKYAVVEAGATEPGEMARLEAIIKPETVVLTGIEPLGGADTYNSYDQKCSELLSIARNAKRIIYPAELTDIVDRHVPPQVLKIAVVMPQGADWMERDRLIAAEALRVYDAVADDKIVRPLYTRLNASAGVNNCTIITDRFTCDSFSLDSALDFLMRRRTPERRVTVILDRLRDGDAKPEIDGVNRIIYVGNGGMSEHEFLNNVAISDFTDELILVKGEDGSAVATFGEQLQARHHETVLEVNLDAVVHNFNHFRAMVKPTTGIVCMVKASGYGAGAYELAKTLQSQGAAYLAVAVVDEGEELRHAGITMPIMALNPKVTNYDSLFSNHLEPEIFSFGMLDEFIREGEKRGIKKYPIHIKFDTGMHRLGFLEDDIPTLCEKLEQTDVVNVETVFSHLATADCLDMDEYTMAQLNLFTSICDRMRAGLGYTFKRHILNSAGIARFPQWQFEMVRLGISLYGVDTIGVEGTKGLRTVSTLSSIIISIKEWPAGTSIGYGRRTILDRQSRIATVPMGYADGLDRHLGNRAGCVWVNGVLCPIVGNICMDACMIDITEAPDVEVGTSVEFFGENLPVGDVSNVLGTIPYEILTSVSPRVKRVYFRE